MVWGGKMAPNETAKRMIELLQSRNPTVLSFRRVPVEYDF
jgi:hypothetical protein